MVTLTVTAGRNRDLGTVTPVATGKSRAAVTVAFLVRGHVTVPTVRPGDAAACPG
jgi:hypothetical protein